MRDSLPAMKPSVSSPEAPSNTAGDFAARARALIGGGRFDEARALMEQACERFPGEAENWFLLGALHGQCGAFAEAARCAERAITLNPRRGDAHFNLALACMRLGDVRRAISAYQRALALDPGNATLLNNLGYALNQVSDFAQAGAILRRALALRPGDADALNNLANALDGQGERDAAIRTWRQCIAVAPNSPAAHFNLAVALRASEDSRAALASLDEAVRLDPGHVEALIGRGLIHTRLGRYADAEAAFRAAIRCDPDSPRAHSGLLFNLNYFSTDPKALFAAHSEWGQRLEVSAAPCETWTNAPEPDRRIRVGYVSPDFRQHSVAWFAEPLIARHDRRAVEVFCYADVARPDGVTDRFRGLADKWRDITGMGVESIVQAIRDDGIDVLVDLAGHTVANLLPVFSRKPAPVQVAWLGYPNTTGLRQVDFRLTDAWADPPGESDALHTESLERLPQGFICYQPPADAPPVAPRRRESGEPVVFGSFNNLAKITPEVVAAWARILAGVPRSRMVLKSRVLADVTARERYKALFAAGGLGCDRVEFRSWAASRSEHLSQYRAIDIALDTYPYNGTTTTCEALWMGVPVVVLAGGAHAGRVGVSLLTQTGLPELVAESVDDYVATAVGLAGDPPRMAALRASLRTRVAQSPLCDAPAFARAVEEIYRRRWRDWCDTQRAVRS
jgi:predicted O-linked N-acetylglucosamine transferase (SPINDLY family)